MFDIILFEPEIPPNTGNVLRLAANAGCRLHLIEPLGFNIDEKTVRRAGLDYAEVSSAHVHRNWTQCKQVLPGRRIFALTTKASHRCHDVRFAAGDAFLFGPESRGLPANILAELGADNCLRLPMMPDCRSLNLSNAVAVTVYEAWRQLGFEKGN